MAMRVCSSTVSLMRRAMTVASRHATIVASDVIGSNVSLKSATARRFMSFYSEPDTESLKGKPQHMSSEVDDEDEDDNEFIHKAARSLANEEDEHEDLIGASPKGKQGFALMDDREMSVFLNGFSYFVTEEDVKGLLEPLPGFVEFRMPRDRFQPDRNRGFVFARFDSIENRDHAISSLNDTMFMDRRVNARPTTSNKNDAGDRRPPRRIESKRPENGTTKIFIGNVPFSATNQDIMFALERCGPVENIRLLTDLDGRSRGFGFVDFESIESADRAVELNEQIEVLGRKIFLGYPKDKQNDFSSQGSNNSRGYASRGNNYDNNRNYRNKDNDGGYRSRGSNDGGFRSRGGDNNGGYRRGGDNEGGYRSRGGDNEGGYRSRGGYNNKSNYRSNDDDDY